MADQLDNLDNPAGDPLVEAVNALSDLVNLLLVQVDENTARSKANAAAILRLESPAASEALADLAAVKM